ncbi:MAG: hypothetical protein Barrevirus11_5 [Barrevirus sp.]|uniref:Uncharacterized protein n=1 Tax=Barrevirus sp. TaxID=2487763 RepID=A0A3G4ZQB5_9VIRU|nr:MAG: hypothetical protein Barrevirus11_5 [Barrevirus sp.]
MSDLANPTMNIFDCINPSPSPQKAEVSSSFLSTSSESNEVPPKKKEKEKRLREEQEEGEVIQVEVDEEEEEKVKEDPSFSIYCNEKPFDKTPKQVFDAISVGTVIIPTNKIVSNDEPFYIMLDSSRRYRRAIRFIINLKFDFIPGQFEITAAQILKVSLTRSIYCLTVERVGDKGHLKIINKQVLNHSKKNKVASKNSKGKEEEEEEEEKEEDEEAEDRDEEKIIGDMDVVPVISNRQNVGIAPIVTNPDPLIPTIPQNAEELHQVRITDSKQAFIDSVKKFCEDPSIIKEAEQRALTNPEVIAKIHELARRRAVAELTQRMIVAILKKLG